MNKYIMRINELTGYKNIELYKKAKSIMSGDIRDKSLYATLNEWQAIMDEYGFKHLGTGSYGSAYEHPSYPWVFKIFKNDKSYFAFLQYARKNQNNPNLPKISGSYIRIRKDPKHISSNDAYVVRLEKLREMTADEWNKIEKIIEIFQDMVADASYGGDATDEEIKLRNQYQGIYDIISAMWNADIFKNSHFDIHSGNVMMRGNVPVIIDPVVD